MYARQLSCVCVNKSKSECASVQPRFFRMHEADQWRQITREALKSMMIFVMPSPLPPPLLPIQHISTERHNVENTHNAAVECRVISAVAVIHTNDCLQFKWQFEQIHIHSPEYWMRWQQTCVFSLSLPFSLVSTDFRGYRAPLDVWKTKWEERIKKITWQHARNRQRKKDHKSAMHCATNGTKVCRIFVCCCVRREFEFNFESKTRNNKKRRVFTFRPNYTPPRTNSSCNVFAWDNKVSAPQMPARPRMMTTKKAVFGIVFNAICTHTHQSTFAAQIYLRKELQSSSCAAHEIRGACTTATFA